MSEAAIVAITAAYAVAPPMPETTRRPRNTDSGIFVAGADSESATASVMSPANASFLGSRWRMRNASRSDIFASSYINFYIANGAIVMPGFGIDRDQEARDQLAALFPDREIVQINIADIAVGGGGIHCITQQQPV
jgi:agmatine/peptidylarginine deiminase